MKKALRKKRVLDVPDIPIAPMIDCVFLMLVYFMTTSSLERSEADLLCPVGGGAAMSDAMPAVDEQIIQLTASGLAIWNGAAIDVRADPAQRAQLAHRLQLFGQTATQAGSEPRLLLQPDPQAPHAAFIRLLDVATASGITSIEVR